MQSTSQPQPKNDNCVQTQTNPHQLGFGPVPAIKPKPTIAQLRDAMNAFNIRGTCRLVAYELLTYWQPGGQVYPSVQTIADGLGKSPRVVQRHLLRLNRIGLWVRQARFTKEGDHDSNLYELHLPGGGGGDAGVTRGGDAGVTLSNKKEVDESELRASASATRTVRTRIDGSKARPLEGAVSPIPKPSPDRQKKALKTLQAADEAFELSLVDGTAVELRESHVEPATPGLKWSGGCPQCGHDRLMGGSCDMCGHDTGTGFRMSADWNGGGD